MTRLVRFSNNAVSRLAANITNAATTISLTPGDGAKFPVISGTQFFMATLIKSTGETEIVKVTARATDTLTVVRAAEPVGATQVAYAFSAGDRIEQRLTAKALSDELDRLDSGANIGATNKTANYTVQAADVSTLIRVDTTAGAITITLPEIASLADDFDIMVAKVTDNANAVNIVRAGSTDLINGATSYPVNNQWQSAWLIADRSTNTWTAINSGAATSSIAVDTFTGDGTAGPYTLSGDPMSKANTAVYLSGVYQQKATYTLSGTSLTMGGNVPVGVTVEVVWSRPLSIGRTDAGLVSYDGGTVQDVLDGAKPMQSYTSLRAYTGRATSVRITTPSIAGIFQRLAVSDPEYSAPDDGGVIIVDASGRRWKRLFDGDVQSSWFITSADGTTDNTIQFLSAMKYCNENGKLLVIVGSINILKASVPSDQIISTYYVKGCSVVGSPGSSIKIDGKLGFDLSNVYDTYVENISVATINRESIESDLESTAPGIFSSRYGTKNSAIYKNIRVSNTLTDASGAYRVGVVIGEYGANIFDVDGVYTNGAMIAVSGKNCTTCTVENVYTPNSQTGVVLTNPATFDVRNVELVNTQDQYNHWIARTATPARLTNGMDAVLVENGGIGSINDIRTEWPIERAVYAQARWLMMNGCNTLNGEGYKMVGASRDSLLTLAKVTDCHLHMDDSYAVGTGRFRPPAFVTYWSKNIDIIGSTASNSSDSNFRLECFLLLGRDAHTVKNVNIFDCEAINANSLVSVPLFTSTAAQLAAIDPAQDFYVADGLSVRKTFIKKPQIQRNGTLVVMTDDTASADAKATYAVKNLGLYDNTIEYNALGARDVWTFDPRYVNTARSENTSVNGPVNGSFFASTVTAPHTGIYLYEPNLKSDAIAGVVSRLGNLNVVEGSKLKFTSVFGGDIVSELDVVAIANGALSTGHKKASVRGKGYYFWDGAINCGISMSASGLQYFGRAISGAKTDQFGTPPVGITVGASSLEVRGDLLPTTYYEMTLNIL